eukprot:TRINITY_DN12728_c0_g4_i2.p1 TRINITY_DN12728_c0_g4~~TRINITY_DN12728_c0_g4_i2.p1  ORF type:complete len:916 (+),score=138.13 TRINITY_DN12728_c0_g4_i2:442-3189(+)
METMENTNQEDGNESLGEGLCCVVVDEEPCVNDAEAEAEEHEIVESSARNDEIDRYDEGMVLEPYVGMQFESLEAAKTFYNDYAQRTGFTVRTGRSERSKRVGEFISKQFVCSKEGFPDRKNKIMPMKPTLREGCKAMIMIKKRDTKWVVTRFEKNHNHELMSTPKELCLVSHRDVSIIAGNEVDRYEGGVMVEPYVGMQFDNVDDAKACYCNYARHLGFNVRIGRSERSKRVGEIISKEFLCSKEGFRRKKHLDRVNRIMPMKPITREGCNAMIMVKKREEKWVVTKFEKTHSHQLMGLHKEPFVQSERHVSSTAKNLMATYEGAEISPSNMCSVFTEEAGGISNVDFTIQDCDNCLDTVRQKVLEKGDAQSVLDYFKRMQADNPAFFYAIQVDEEERMTNFFWVDARSRMSYKYFGDVVSFDTTYRKNRYQMAFAPFTGVNHHQQPVLLGCALLLDESEASFVWLFKTWLVAMSGRQPTSIITDQDEAIGTAVSRVFPESRHRLCMWYIKSEVPKKLGHVFDTHDTFQGDFCNCIDLAETIDEFESSWRALIEKYDLGENEWLQSVYNIREKWVPAYLRDTFFGGLCTTDRSDSLNSYFDGHVNQNTTLQEFVTQYDKALDYWYSKEYEEDFKTIYTKPTMKTPLLMEEQMAEIYTRYLFAKFQEELCVSLRYIAIITNDDGMLRCYRVTKFGEERSHTVTLNVSQTKVTCSCQMFEFMGILCRHALIVLRLINVLILPSDYILDRWTRNAKSGAVYDECGNVMVADCQESSTMRYNDLFRQAIEYAAEGATSVETYKVACSALRRSFVEVRNEKQRIAQLCTLSSGVIQEDNIVRNGIQAETSTNQIALCDPRCVTSKGRRKAPILNGSLEKSQKKIKKNTTHGSMMDDSSNDPPSSQFYLHGLFLPSSENV